MKAESTIKPAQFKIEGKGEYVNIRFFTDVAKKGTEHKEGLEDIWEYNEYNLENIRNRPGLTSEIENNLEAWLQLAIEKENEPKPEAEREKVIRLEKENKQLGIEVSEREIQEIIQGQQISDLEIQLLELQMGGM